MRVNRYGQFHYGESYYYSPIPINVGKGDIFINSQPLIIFEVPPVQVGNGNIEIHKTLDAIKYYIPLYISKDNIMHFLELKILRDTRLDIVPENKEIIEYIPGRHGEIYFKSKLRPRTIELHVASPEFNSMEERDKWKHKVAALLQETINEGRPLIFENEITKTYLVKYAGRIDLDQYWNWTKFIIPFKLATPYITGTFQKKLTGNGIAVNDGNQKTAMLITIYAKNGNVVDPSFTVGNLTATYTGTINHGEQLTINTDKLTIDINGVNAMTGYNGVFPFLKSGENIITTNNDNNAVFTFYWFDRWI